MKKQTIITFAIISVLAICSVLYVTEHPGTKNITTASENTPTPKKEATPSQPTHQAITYEEYKESSEWMTTDSLSIKHTKRMVFTTVNQYFTHLQKDSNLIYHIDNNGKNSFQWHVNSSKGHRLAGGHLQTGESKTFVTSSSDVPPGEYELHIQTDDG